MRNEKEYTFSVDTDDIQAIITGRTDHVIQALDSDFASATLEDKAICLKMSSQEISQVVTQVDFEVGQMERFLNYVPREYVGILQNGPVWIAVLRRIDRGRVLWTYIQTSPAFIITGDGTSERTATPVNPASCVEIARLVEHAYSIADNITEEILYPDRRPMNAIHTIKEYHNLSDNDEDDSGDDNNEGEDHGDHQDEKVPDGGGVSEAVAPAKPGRSAAQQQQQKQRDGAQGNKKPQRAQSIEDDYFLLPLSHSSLTSHATAVR
jgi:hypothetical protein